MSHHFVDLLEDLKSRLARMTALVQQIVDLSVESIFSANAEIAQRAIDSDTRIDEEEVVVEKSAIDLIALYQPTAVDLRLISAIIKANNDFERIADCAVNIAQRVLLLARLEAYGAPDDLRLMGTSVTTTLRETIKAFNFQEDQLARQVLRSDDVVDALYHQIVQDMLTSMETNSQKVNADLAYIMIAKNLERIADHCTNIAENVIYVASGKIIRHRHAG